MLAPAGWYSDWQQPCRRVPVDSRRGVCGDLHVSKGQEVPSPKAFLPFPSSADLPGAASGRNTDFRDPRNGGSRRWQRRKSLSIQNPDTSQKSGGLLVGQDGDGNIV